MPPGHVLEEERSPLGLQVALDRSLVSEETFGLCAVDRLDVDDVLGCLGHGCW